MSTPKEKLDQPTQMLFYLVSLCPYLADQFGVSLNETGKRMSFDDRPRPWLKKREGKTELSFDPDTYAETLNKHPEPAEDLLHRFVLNLWDHNGCAAKGWTFNLFAAMQHIDADNREGIGRIIASPVWPYQL